LRAEVAGDPRVIEVYLGTDADASLATAAAAQARRRVGA
jgi:branched-chain amino acid transport system ATP-binding protein